MTSNTRYPGIEAFTKSRNAHVVSPVLTLVRWVEHRIAEAHGSGASTWQSRLVPTIVGSSFADCAHPTALDVPLSWNFDDAAAVQQRARTMGNCNTGRDGGPGTPETLSKLFQWSRTFCSPSRDDWTVTARSDAATNRSPFGIAMTSGLARMRHPQRPSSDCCADLSSALSRLPRRVDCLRAGQPHLYISHSLHQCIPLSAISGAHLRDPSGWPSRDRSLSPALH
jgi:hypothetical protein